MSGPSITFDPTSISFGSVAVGSGSTQNLNIKTVGFGPFSITNVSNSVADFSSGISLGILNTGDNIFPMNFNPSSAIFESDVFVISIFDNGTGNTTDYDFAVDGTGTTAPPAAVTGFVSVISQ